MSDDSGGSSHDRDLPFSGGGASAVADYQSWKKWARARLVVERERNQKEDTYGPLLYTLLDGVATDALEDVELDELAVAGGEEKRFDVLGELFP